MKPIIFFFFLLFLVSNSYAYECNKLTGVDQQNCLELNSVNENLIANIIYKNSSFPDYDFINNYNSQIIVASAPNNTPMYNQGIIQKAWISILYINPSVYFNQTLYVPDEINTRAEYNYSIVLPANYYYNKKTEGRTCQIIYSKSGEQSNIRWLVNNKQVATGKILYLVSNNYSSIIAQATIQTNLQADNYVWKKTCCRSSCNSYCLTCKYTSTTYTPYSIQIQDTLSVQQYIASDTPRFTIIGEYKNTTKGVLMSNNWTSIILKFDNSYFENQKFYYEANFSKKPYYFLTLTAYPIESIKFRNLLVNDNVFYTNSANTCSLEYYTFFEKQTTFCQRNTTEQESEKQNTDSTVINLTLLLKILVFFFVIYLIYRGIKHYWGKALIPIGVLLLTIPGVRAEDCGLSNLATCIPQKIFDFILNLFNAPLEPLLNLVKNLLQASPSIELFHGVWVIIIYCLSLFYAILFVYSGFQFLVSGHDVLRREMAKEWFKNTVIMIVFIQASYYLYGLIVEIGSRMTSSVLSMIDPHFFMLTADNLLNAGLELLFVLLYVIILLITAILLIMRYLIVATGVLFVPLGIFCYYIPPLRSYGQLILNILGMFIFITFIDAILILACSMLITIPLFQNIKILVMITCFMIIDWLFVILLVHIVHKAANNSGTEKLSQAAKYIATMI